jgi:16S rRNA (guanine(966)-N(2))-methyltransferase RsmD
MSRIIAGAGKGRRLKTAGGDATRPTGARVRQSLFDILAPLVPGCRFLDAFAGNGGVGLEALSRGAATVALVDKSSAAVEAAKENARALARAGGEVRVFRQDARTAIGALGDQGMRFDVVYLDPPYDSDLYEPLLAVLGEGPLLAEGGVVVAEHFHKRALPETIGALTRTRMKRVGDHVLSFYRRASGADRTAGADEGARGADGRADGTSGGRGNGSEGGQSEEEAS